MDVTGETLLQQVGSCEQTPEILQPPHVFCDKRHGMVTLHPCLLHMHTQNKT